MKQTEFGKTLAKVRKSKGLTQIELADKCSLSSRTIQRIEAGIVSPRSYTIRTLSAALDYDFLKELSIEVVDEQKCELRRFGKWFFFQIIDLFNFKTNIMRKLLILTTISVLVAIAVLFFSNKTSAQESDTLINFLTIECKVDISQKEALKIIGNINKKAQYHNKSIDLLKTYAEKSDFNYDTYVHLAVLIASFGYATQSAMEIANITFMTNKECKLFKDIASLIFLYHGNGANTFVELAKSASQAKTEDEIKNIQESIQTYKTQAKFSNLNEAFEKQKIKDN